jgi:hypothetical protein
LTVLQLINSKLGGRSKLGYTSRRNRRPSEYASKGGHLSIINEEAVNSFIKRCKLPFASEQIKMDSSSLVDIEPLEKNPIEIIIAVDGGYGETLITKEFPSSTLTFFNFGALMFKVSDLEDLREIPFIDPVNIAKLKRIQRFHFILPTRNISLEGNTLTNSARQALFEFFTKKHNGEKPFIEALRWLIFKQYGPGNSISWNLASCPNCDERNIVVTASMGNVFNCDNCGGHIYLTDIFRFHEVIDDEIGAGGVIAYTMALLEQILIVHLIKVIWEVKPDLLKHILFIKDGPMAFFGQTANLHKPMRDLINFIYQQNNRVNTIYLAGIEKSGAFVDHANEIRSKINPDQALMINNNYVYKYIIPGKPDPVKPYGSSTYYGNKVIFRTCDDKLYVLTLPTLEVSENPKVSDFPGFHIILNNIAKLKCDMYDDALIPVALVNKLVSLSQHPSITLLEQYVKKQIG